MTTGSVTVLAVDPGLTSGVAIWHSHLRDDPPWACQLDVPGFWRLAEQMTAGRHVVVICEAFVISTRTIKGSQQTWPLEHIGVLKYLCAKHGHQIVLQQASAAKTAVTNERLREWGWYQPGQDHANDALRHLGLYLIRTGTITAHGTMPGRPVNGF